MEASTYALLPVQGLLRDRRTPYALVDLADYMHSSRHNSGHSHRRGSDVRPSHFGVLEDVAVTPSKKKGVLLNG